MIWIVSEFIQDFIHVHLICMFQNDPIKPEWVVLMIKSNIGFFNNRGDISLRQIIPSGLVSNSPEIPSMSTLTATFRKIWSKLKQLCWQQSQTGFFQQSVEVTLKINDQIWSGLKFIREFIHVPLICKFQKDPIKTQWVMLMTNSNKGFFLAIEGTYL